MQGELWLHFIRLSFHNVLKVFNFENTKKSESPDKTVKICICYGKMPILFQSYRHKMLALAY